MSLYISGKEFNFNNWLADEQISFEYCDIDKMHSLINRAKSLGYTVRKVKTSRLEDLRKLNKSKLEELEDLRKQLGRDLTARDIFAKGTKMDASANSTSENEGVAYIITNGHKVRVIANAKVSTPLWLESGSFVIPATQVVLLNNFDIDSFGGNILNLDTKRWKIKDEQLLNSKVCGFVNGYRVAVLHNALISGMISCTIGDKKYSITEFANMLYGMTFDDFLNMYLTESNKSNKDICLKLHAASNNKCIVYYAKNESAQKYDPSTLDCVDTLTNVISIYNAECEERVHVHTNTLVYINTNNKKPITLDFDKQSYDSDDIHYAIFLDIERANQLNITIEMDSLFGLLKYTANINCKQLNLTIKGLHLYADISDIYDEDEDEYMDAMYDDDEDGYAEIEDAYDDEPEKEETAMVKLIGGNLGYNIKPLVPSCYNIEELNIRVEACDTDINCDNIGHFIMTVFTEKLLARTHVGKVNVVLVDAWGKEVAGALRTVGKG